MQNYNSLIIIIENVKINGIYTRMLKNVTAKVVDITTMIATMLQ